jgi:hypothetical protein
MDLQERNDLYYKAIAWAEHDFAAVCRRVNDLAGADIQIACEVGAYCRNVGDVEAIANDTLPAHALIRPCKCGEVMRVASSREVFYESCNLTSFMDWCCEKYGLDWEVEDNRIPRHESYFRVWGKDYNEPIFRVRLVNNKAGMVAKSLALSWLGPEWEKRFDTYREERYAKRGWPVVKAYLEKKREHATA